MRTDYIISQAESVVSEFGERNPFHVAKQYGVSVNFKDLGSLRGAYFGTMPTPAIVINENLDETMKNIICAHELGHHILHRGSTQSCDSSVFNSTGVFEKDANTFAAVFLIDKNHALKLLSEGLSINEVAAVMRTDINLLMTLLNTMQLSDAPDSSFLK